MSKTCGGLEPHCPTIAPTIIFTILFTITASYHLYQAITYRKRFCWVLIMGNVWELIGMVTRLATIKVYLDAVDTVSFLFTLLAPLWINAFAYMTLGRLVYMTIPQKKLAGIKAQKLGKYFVLADISCFIIQLAGGLMTDSDDPKDANLVKTGLKIYTAGTSLQECVILGFAVLSFIFTRRLRKDQNSITGIDKESVKKLMIVLYIVIGLIAYRTAFRIVEFSVPLDSVIYTTIRDHEYFLYLFDITPMFFALVAFNVYHPGKTLQGPDSEYPKVTRKEKKALKAEKKLRKQEMKAAKKGGYTGHVMGRGKDNGMAIGHEMV